MNQRKNFIKSDLFYLNQLVRGIFRTIVEVLPGTAKYVVRIQNGLKK